MRSVLIRLAALSAGVLIVASCDTRLPTATTLPTSTGSTGSTSSSSTTGPTVVIDTPLTGAQINVGDSVLVTFRLHDNKQLKNATVNGVTERGSTDLGTYTQTPRYKSVLIPAGGTFRTGLRDTTIRRYLQPINAADTTLDSLRIVVIATDSTGGADTATRRINIVAGPQVTIVAPTGGDSIPAGVGLSVAARAQQTNGVTRIDIHVVGEANWPTKLDTSFSQTYSNNPRDITFSAIARVPVDAPLRSRITITATAVDVDRQPGSSAPVVAYVRSASTAIPRVLQTVLPKSEFTDSVVVRATGEAITTVGLIIRDSTGSIMQRDTVKLSAPFTANVQVPVALGLAPSLQGKRLSVTAFAVDQAGRTGYAVPASRANAEGDLNAARVDSTLIVYGRTYPLPQQGTIGDIAVDASRGHVFLSNTAFNLVDVWQSAGAAKGFSGNGIAVGSLPWGLYIADNTLLVANSGGTNISRVPIASTEAANLHEDLAARILTRNTYVYTVTMQRDETTNKIKLSATGPISYSDRPQYIAQSKGGRVFYSTRPTPTAPQGTIRWLDPTLPVPDPRQIWEYGQIVRSTDQTFALLNVDSIAIIQQPPTSDSSDKLIIWDHPYGQRTGTVEVVNSVPQAARDSAIAHGSDAELVQGLVVGSLGLTDTTYAAASGNRNWVAFGEGNKPGAGRVIMIADSVGNVPNFYSPVVTIQDLTDNASEPIFGIALDVNGGTVAAHGQQSFFSMVEDPFHLRLQGKYDSFDNGAGITFHPNAAGTLSAPNQRLAFVGAASGVVEIVDIAYYINRGKLQLKNPIYGPLRASLPMPGDSPDVVMKLYAVGQQGLVVIDLTANDIKPGPP